MFATIQDTSGSIELLVFPKIYETTQAVWREGNIVCVVGKTPREEGDNKVFVENVYVLTHDNASQVASQITLGKQKTQGGEFQISDFRFQINERAVVLRLSKDEVKRLAEPLKTLFAKYPGEYQVYVDVEGKRIRAGARVAWGDDVRQELTQFIGADKLTVHATA